MEILKYLPSLIYLIPEGVILAATIILINRSKTTAGYLLFITSIIRIVLQLLHSFFPYVISNLDHSVSEISKYYMGVGVIGFINNTVFGIGLILLVTDHFKKVDNFKTGTLQ